MNTILNALRSGQFVAVTDDETRENEADLVVAAECITNEQMAFLIRYTSGIICVPMPEERLHSFGLERLVNTSTVRFGTPFTMPVDYTPGTTSGVSAADRVATVKALLDEHTDPKDFGVPGHVFPLMEASGGLKNRKGHTEASLALLRLAGFQPIAVIGELMNDDGTMMRGQSLQQFLNAHDIPLCSIQDILDTLEA